MPYYVPSGFSRVQIDYGTVSGLGSRPTFGFGVSAPPSVAMLDSIYDWIYTELILRTGNAWAIQGVRMYDNVNAIERPELVAGGISTAQAAPNLAALVSLATSLRGRENRGRMYIPGVLFDADVQDDGSLTTARRESLQDMVVELRAHLDDGFPGADLVILHTAEATPTEVVTAVVQGVPATQRRRLRK